MPPYRSRLQRVTMARTAGIMKKCDSRRKIRKFVGNLSPLYVIGSGTLRAGARAERHHPTCGESHGACALCGVQTRARVAKRPEKIRE